MDDQKIITGLDLGSDCVKCLMAGIKDNKLEIIAQAKVEHSGIQNRQIVDSKATASAIRRACQEVEIMSERPITDLWVCLPYSFRTFSSEGMAIITGGTVQRQHILQAIATARAVPLPDHQEVVHILPIYFKVDRKEQIFNPVGLSGLRLETLVFLVTCDLSSLEDLKKCFKDAGRSARGFVAGPLAGSLAALSEEDKNQGAVAINMGKSFSQAAVFFKGRLIYMRQFPCGGDDITGDIINELKLSPETAEKIKIQYGCPPAEGKEIAAGEKSIITQKTLSAVVTKSLERAFSPIKTELSQHGLLERSQSGIILTGGASRLKNLDVWAKDYFNKTCKQAPLIGVPYTFSMNTSMASALGLIYYAKDDRLDFKEKSKMAFRNWFKDLMN